MFNEENSVEDYIKDLLIKLGWEFIPRDLMGRDESEVLVEREVQEALIRLNSLIAASPDLADEVLYRLRGLLVSVRGGSGLVGANEEFSAWLRNEKTMPFGNNGEHVSIKLIDFDNLQNNTFIITTQYALKLGQNRRPDLVLLVNGFPLIIGEAKTPVRPSISWVDGAIQLDEYQKSIAGFFVPNLLMFATEGKSFRVGSIKLPLEQWGPWRDGENETNSLGELQTAVMQMLTPKTVLELLKNFTLFSVAKGGMKIKLMPRYQQFKAANQIVERVAEGKIKRGLIWHFQGSGKSLLMVYAATMLRNDPRLKNPTVLVVVDRIDLKSQIGATFNATSVANTVTAESRAELQKILKQDARKVVITNIHLFGEAEGALNERDNIIVLVDEAHRTQEGDLGIKMRSALPNAFMFGLTGTPINTRDRNTFAAFGAKEDANGYMDRYSFQQSLKDEATLPIYFEPRLVELHIDQKKIDEVFDELTDTLDVEDRAILSQQAGKFEHIAKSPDRIEKITHDIVEHFRKRIEPNGFKGQVVVYDRTTCHLYKLAIDKLMRPEESAVVMSVNKSKDPQEFRELYDLSDDQQEKILERFRDPNDPLKLLIVTAKLLTGFDAPIEQVMYLDKPLKDHTLLQAICRTNRTSKNKTHGLIVDYIGIFDNVAKALDFDEKEIVDVVSNISNLKNEIPDAMKKCLNYFPGVDRDLDGYEGLLAAQDCLKDNEIRDTFAADFSYLTKHWEAVSPDPILNEYKKDYRWLSQVYESIRPTNGKGKLVWHALGEKTIQLIHESIDVIAVHDDMEALILDAEALENVHNPKKVKEIELKIIWNLHQKANDPRFLALGERLEKLKEQHYQQAINSLEFLKELLNIAREIVEVERETEALPVDTTKEALTQIFLECKTIETPRIVEMIVDDIDSVVKVVRFDGWQWTSNGEREVKAAIRRALLKYKLHKDEELFAKAYEYIREHY